MKRKSFLFRHLSVLFTAVALSASATSSLAADSVYEELQERRQFSTLVAAIDAAGLADALSGEDASFTVFAPTNDAFGAIPEETLTALLADPGALGDVLKYHVLGEKVRFRDLESQNYTTLAGSDLVVEVTTYFRWFRMVEVNNARITSSDIRANNGVIHGINAVLDPAFMPVPTLRELLDTTDDGNFGILASLLDDAGYASTLDNPHHEFTLLAPTDEAFAAIPEDALNELLADRDRLRKTLLNHLVRGTALSSDLSDGAQVNTLARQHLSVSITPSDDPDGAPTIQIGGATVINADVEASNGVLHAIDSVLVIAPPQSIVDVAQTRDDLSTFVTALDVAGLVDTFDKTTRYPSFTVFVPNNDAFAALPEGALASLIADPEALADVLKLHVVAGRFTASDLRDGQLLKTLNDKRLNVAIGDESGSVSINNATVIEANIEAANGIIHIIDNVIVNDPFTVADLIKSKPYLSTLNAALEAASLTGALDGGDELTVIAPLNSAFDRLPEGTVEALLADIPALTGVLTYHVVPGSQSIHDLAEAGNPATLQGSEIEVERRTLRFWRWRYTFYRINGNYVVATNLKADNGTVHVINGVLIPPAAEGDGEVK